MRRCPCSEAHCTSICTSKMRKPPGFSIGGTWGQWRSRGGRKQELEDPEIVFPMIVTFVCFEEKVKVGAIWSPLSLFPFFFFSFNFSPIENVLVTY